MKNKIYNKKLSLPGLTKVSLSGLTRQSLLAAALFTFFSCTNLVESNDTSSSSQDKRTANGETYLVINSTSVKKTTSRSAGTGNLSPTRDDVKTENLTNLVVSGRETSSSDTEMARLATADSLIELKRQKIKIDAGNWTFKLSAELGGIPFSSNTVTKTIKQGVENTVTFVLTSDLKYGGLEITIEWTNEASKVVATLMDAAQTKAIDSKTYEDFDTETSSLSYKRDIKKDSEQLASGTYYLKFDFYNGTTSAIFDTFDAYVNIADGLITRKSLSIELSKTFEIEYHANGGELAEGETQPLKYSRKSSELTLPEMTKPGYFWGGWYENEDLTGEPITAIPANTGVAKSFYAKWNEPVLYVSGTGDDTNNGFTADTALKTIDGACEKIIALDNPECEYVIKIIGEVKGVPKGTSGTDATYGPNTIPEEVNGCAKSILLTGNTPVATDFAEPSDYLNRAQAENANGVSNGTVLSIKTTVPVTITNLKITGGYGSNGGGMYISPDSTVILGDGVLITNNRTGSNGVGGGICNEGTLYMHGTAVVGDKTNGGKAAGTPYSYGKDSSSYKDQENKTRSNYGDSGGGGIYNGNKNDSSIIAKLYLGYKPDADGKPEKEELKGGIYYNGGAGGGLYNAAGSIAYFDSGTFAWNGSDGGGGAIMNAGTIEMSGGLIEHNRTTGTNAAYGGAVNNKANAKFIMSGGTINHNIAFRFYSYGDLSYGGAVYNQGQFYMYGNAVIGDKDATTVATGQYEDSEQDNITNNVTAWGNKAYRGGAIYGEGNGSAIYIGYKPNETSGEPEEAELTGGIYYNYASFSTTITDTSNQYGGGAIETNGTLKIASGTIAYNSTNAYGGAIRYVAGNNDNVFEIKGGTIKNNIAKCYGGAIYLGVKNAGNANVLYLGGSPVIPVENSVEGFENYLNDIYIRGLGTTIQLISSLPQTFTTSLSFYEYNTTINPLKIKADSGVTLADEYSKFKVIDENLNGRTRMWKTTAEGKLEPVVTSFYVSETGASTNDGLTKDTAFAAVSSAFAKIWMNYNQDHSNANQDYIIYISGNVNDRVNIEDMQAVKYANSITLQGLNGLDTSTNLPKDTINGNYADGGSGNTISISSIIPVAIKALNITGSKMAANNSLTAGLYINPNSTVSIEDGTVISDNDRGVYAVQASLFIDGATIKNNTSNGDGAGLTSRSSNVKMLNGSISNNSFNTDFLTANNITEVSGGGIYLDNSTFEMTGGTINDNCSANSSVTVTGKGIYVSSDSTFNMGGTAFVSLENDVYLDNNVKVNVISKLKENASLNFARNDPAAMLTPAIYPTQDTEGNITENVELLNLVDSELKMYDIAKLFRITPQKINNDLQYWKIDSSDRSETYGKFIKISGTTVTVNYSSGWEEDVAVSSEGNTIEDGAVIPGGGTLTFTATAGYSSYKWTVEGNVQSTPATTPHILSIDTTNWDYGIYDIYLEVKDSSGKRYSYTSQIKVSEN